MVVEKGITQIVYNRATIAGIEKAAQKLKKQARVVIKVDTGLGRVGVKHDEATNFIKAIYKKPLIQIEGLFSTLTDDRALDRLQLERITQLNSEPSKHDINPGIISMASSTAILHFPETPLDAVRPGIILYAYTLRRRTAKQG